ncbi:MAG: hypothetical protein AB8H47_28245 [Bacteroidia bacterium]
MSVSKHPEKLVETAIATYQRYPSGVILLTMKPYARIELEGAKEFVKVCLEISAGEGAVVLIDNSHPHTTTLKARRFLSDAKEIAAAAGLSNNSMSAFLGNLWIRTVPPVYPSKIFTSKESAVEWLSTFC